MDKLDELSKNWKGDFSVFENEINTLLKSSAYEEDIKKATAVYMSGKQLNELSDSDYRTYDKTFYKDAIFDNDSNYKVKKVVFDYDCTEKHKILFIETM